MTAELLDNLARAISRAVGGLWLRNIPALERALATSAVAGLPVDTLLERAAHHACLGHCGKAANWIAVACLLHREEAWRALRRRGLFRCSKYDFNPATPLAIALLISKQRTALRLSDGHFTYIQSVIELLRFGSAAQSEFNGLARDLRRQRNFMAQSCLITLDFLFMQDSHPDLDFGITWSTAPWTKEELAEGLSFLWAIAERHFGITRWVASLWDAEAIIEGEYLRVLQRAAWLREFSQAEILIDAFDYRCSALQGPRSVALVAPSPELEKSIRFGYIGQEMRQAILGAEAKEAESVSCRDIGAALHEVASRAGLIETVDTFPRRVRFHIPERPELFEDIRKLAALKEELVQLAEAMQSYGLTPTGLDEFHVTAALSLGDIIRVQCFAAIVGSYAATELARWRADPQRMINSVSFVHRGDDILMSFLRIALSPEAAKDFVDLFGWPRRDGAKVVFDIQYRPLVDTEGEWHVPTHILARSNLMRAALVITKLRPASVRKDLIEDPIVEELRRQKCLAAKNVKIKASGEHTEIDVAAIVDDVLLIIECKASLLPCNIFELRTSYDAIETAVTQLDRIRRILADPVAKTRLLERLDARGREFRRILTGIVVENRLFSGLKPNGHLIVTQAHLLNIIEGGDMRFGNACVPIRSREPLSAAIEDFMSGGLYNTIFDSMVNHQRSYPSESGNIVYDTYLLDVAALARKYGVELDTE